MTIPAVPAIRLHQKNDAPPQDTGKYVLYWMIAARRPFHNYSLQHALYESQVRDLPLLVFEPLRHGYPHACDRFHAFVLQGMAANQEVFRDHDVRYFPFVETSDHPGTGLLNALAHNAALVITDEFPAFFLPSMVDAAARKLQTINVPLITVDANGLTPLRAPDKIFTRAYDFRRYLHKNLTRFTEVRPLQNPLATYTQGKAHIPQEILDRWPPATPTLLSGSSSSLQDLPIDHSIAPVAFLPGGHQAATNRLHDFLERIDDYTQRRNDPTQEASSGLSPYLHFGHIGAHTLFEALRHRYHWSPDHINNDRLGKNQGFWGLPEGPETFIDQFWTWREIGFNRSFMDPDGYASYDTLPDWAQKTLAEHQNDPREHLYTLEDFDQARTHDDLWNAAQNELRRDGRIHNYLRMLWAKKILHWSESPQMALKIMLELNNKYALDGRDPNSYSGIFWALGRFDRAWGPEREVFGKIRYMTSDSTRRKFNVHDYIDRYTSSSHQANQGSLL